MPKGEERHNPLADGAAIAQLRASPQDWIKRRVELIQFEDDKIARRSVSVDFRLLDLYRNAKVGARPRPLAPLALLTKEPLTNFDLRDEDGASLPLLTSVENGELISAALIGAAAHVLEGHQRELEEEVAKDLQRVAVCSLEHADEALTALFKTDGPSALNQRLLAQDVALRKLTKDLAHNFPVLTPIADPTERRVLKFAYQRPVRYAGGAGNGLLTALGWRSAAFQWGAGGASMTGSYHCEIEAPSNLEIMKAELFTRSRDGVKKLRSGSGSKRVHLYVSNVLPTANPVLRANLRAERRGMLRSSTMLGIGVAILLTVGLFFRDSVASSGDDATGLLVAVPALLAAYLTRPGEHQLATRLLFGVRFLVATSGVLAFTAAASLVADFNTDRTLLAVWIPLAGLAWIVAGGLVLSLALPRRKYG